MNRWLRWMAAGLGAALLAGCSEPVPGRMRSLGSVPYEAAFAASREVMSQYFSVSRADPETGIIETRPQPAEAPPERLLGASPARQVATLRLRQEDGRVVAHCSVAVQREGSSGHRQMNPAAASYDSVPNKTPAEAEAATTPDQNEVWRTERYDHALAGKILDDIFVSLHPDAGR